jgi:hypothetical protein
MHQGFYFPGAGNRKILRKIKKERRDEEVYVNFKFIRFFINHWL